MSARDAAAVSNDATAGGPAIDMRPKWVWARACALTTVASLASAADGGGWTTWLGVVLFGWWTAAAIRSRIRVEDAVLYRRGTLGWYAPLDLRRLQHVALRRSPDPRWAFGRYLLLRDQDRHEHTIWLLWWSNWEPLAALVARSVLLQPPGIAPGFVTTIDIDGKDGQRLAAFF